MAQRRPQDEQINKPNHYQFGSFQAIDVIEGVSRGVCDPVAAVLTSHALKYLMRWPRKHGLRDLKKARWYLDRLICYLDRVHIPPAPDYDPASVAFRHGDLAKVCGIGDVPHDVKQHRVVVGNGWVKREFAPHAGDLDDLRAERSEISFAQAATNAKVIAHSDGAGDYGNPTTPWKLP